MKLYLLFVNLKWLLYHNGLKSLPNCEPLFKEFLKGLNSFLPVSFKHLGLPLLDPSTNTSATNEYDKANLLNDFSLVRHLLMTLIIPHHPTYSKLVLQ